MKKFLKKSGIKIISAVAIVCSFMALSLACASAPEPEPTTTITLSTVNNLVKNQEASLLANNGLTGEQLMEVIKLCIHTGEISNVSLVEENAKLSYGVLAANITLYKVPVVVKFSCSISKTGSLKMRVIDVKEQNSDTAPFNLEVYKKDYDSICESIQNKIMGKVKNFGEVVITRSADFA